MGLSDWIRWRFGRRSKGTNNPRFTPLGGKLDRVIEDVALLVDDPTAFRAEAVKFGRRLGPDSLPHLRERFHRSTPAPAGFGPRERGLSAWLSYWQFAIFEIVFQFREAALPMLREVAFGEYDWSQSHAVEILCRLAAEGIERDRSIAEIKSAMPAMRDTALLYIAQSLLAQRSDSPNLAAIVSELQRVPEFQAAIDELGDNSTK